jgi:hypothetical protein
VNVERGGGGRSGQGGSQSRQRWGRCHQSVPHFCWMVMEFDIELGLEFVSGGDKELRVY